MNVRIYMKNRIIKFTLQTAPPYRPFANNNTHTQHIKIGSREMVNNIRENEKFAKLDTMWGRGVRRLKKGKLFYIGVNLEKFEF